MTAPEFSRVIDLRQIGNKPLHLVADETERRRLAGRFSLSAIDSLEADVELVPEGPVVTATGRLRAAVIQACAVSGEDFPVSIDEPLFVRFVPAVRRVVPDEEIELDADELDEVEYEGTAFDLGEAVAQSLALAIDPFAEGPNADAARKAAGLGNPETSGAFAALAALRRDD